MRRLVWGLLAVLGLISLVGCGTGGDAATTTPEPTAVEDRAVTDTALVSASRDTSTNELPIRPAEFSILLTSPEGVVSPGLDALVSALLGRPDLRLTVVAPAADATGSGDERSARTLAPVPVETMTGHPAAAVNGTMADTLDVVLAEPSEIDLIVIGATSDPEAERAADAIQAAGLPSLVVTVGADPDLAAASLLLLDAIDYQLDALVTSKVAHVLDVTACAGGVDGPSMITGDTEPTPECTAQAMP